MQWKHLTFAGLALTIGLALAGEAEAQAKNPYAGKKDAATEGQQIYLKYGCFGCHGREGGGGMGPSLIDTGWKYGGSDAEVFKSIKAGRPQGMPPWGDKLKDDEIWKIVSYLRSLYKGDASAVAW